MIDVTIGTIAMTVIVIEIMTAPVAMIQEGIVLVPGSTGATTDTEAAQGLADDFVVVLSFDKAIMLGLRYFYTMYSAGQMPDALDYDILVD
jgi:hypothetical protein